jgi:hypothetical protein
VDILNQTLQEEGIRMAMMESENYVPFFHVAVATAIRVSDGKGGTGELWYGVTYWKLIMLLLTRGAEERVAVFRKIKTTTLLMNRKGQTAPVPSLAKLRQMIRSSRTARNELEGKQWAFAYEDEEGDFVLIEKDSVLGAALGHHLSAKIYIALLNDRSADYDSAKNTRSGGEEGGRGSVEALNIMPDATVSADHNVENIIPDSIESWS